jgi:FHA domain-containing protein
LTKERASGRDIILAIGENMRQSLEPLMTKTLAPSLYQVYLHADDHDRLRSIFPELEADAQRLLDREIAQLNRSAVPAVDRLLAPLRRRKPAGEPAMRYVSAEGRWFIEFQEDPNGRLGPGDIEVVSEFAQRPTAGYGAGNPTKRISTTRRMGRMTTEQEVVDPQRAYARIQYDDDRGRQSFLVTRDQIVIGREGGHVWVDLRLETSLDVSREHARLQRVAESGRFRIKDLSKLGTTVDGRPLPPSLEVIDGEARDRDRWVDLPDRARIGLADVVFLDFERLDPR